MRNHLSSDDYLNEFEQRLQQNLLRQLHARGVMGTQLLGSDDLDDKFETYLQEYLADALPQIVDYPMVSIAWATYIGLGLAYLWDTDFERFAETKYSMLYGPRGFDDMDEHILYEVMGNQPEDVKGLVQLIQSISQSCLSAIKAEQIEPQSSMAFHVYVRTVVVAFRIGAALQLYAMGYKYEKLEADN